MTFSWLNLQSPKSATLLTITVHINTSLSVRCKFDI